MLFRKPNRRATAARKSNPVPAVESVEDRLLLSAVASPTADMVNTADLERQEAFDASAANQAEAGHEQGPHRHRHHHHQHGGHHRSPDRMDADDAVIEETVEETTDEIVEESVGETTEDAAANTDAGDDTADELSGENQTSDDATDSTDASSDTTSETDVEDETDVSAETADAETSTASDSILTSIDTTDVVESETTDAVADDSDVVLEWNDLFGELLAADAVTQNPGYASRSMAILNLAIYDAVNIAEGNFASTFYEYGSEITDLASGASAEVAASQAAYTVLTSLYPDQQATIDAFAVSNFGADSGSAVNDGSIALGIEVGSRILTERADDGSAVFSVYEYTDEVGYFSADPLNPDVPAWGPAWGEVDTFAISSSDDFLPETTPPLTSEEYAASYNEVLELGAADSEVRTAEQTEIGLFWAYDREGLGTPMALFNDILQTVAIQEGNTFEENVTLFAQASVALADAGVTAWDTKFTEEFWRPVTAIHEGDADGNDLTEGDPEWVALGAPDGGDDEIGFTPQFPTYISGHATFGAALFGTLQNFYGTDDIAFEVTSTELEILLDDPELQEAYGLDLEDATRSFSSFSEAMAENGRSRVYLGIHFDFDDLVGQEVGQAVAASVAEKFASLAGESDDSTTAYVDLAEVGSGNVTVRAVDGNLEIVDNETRTVVSSQSLAETDSVTVVGRDGQSDRIVVAGITASDLPGGLIVQAGDGADDTLVITGSSETDTIFIDQDHVDVNGLQVAFTGVERVVIRGIDTADTIEVADGIDFDVDVRDEFDNERTHDGRQHRNHLAGRQSNLRQSQERNRKVAQGNSENAARKSDSSNRVLDAFFASDDLNRLLSMRTDQRRR